MSHITTMSLAAMRKFYPKWDVPLTGEERAGYRGTVCSVSATHRSQLSDYLDDLLESLVRFQIDPDYILLSKEEIRKLVWHRAWHTACSGRVHTNRSDLAQGRPQYINQSTGNSITLAYEKYATLIFLYHPKDIAHE